MDIKSLSLFADVARLGSFAEAARRHDTDPSSVSRSIAALEGQVGARLLQRSTRRMSLTEAGTLFLGRVEPLIAEIARATEDTRSLGGEISGTLRLTASVAFAHTAIVPLLATFRADHPKLALDLNMTDANLDLVTEKIDLAIRLAPQLSGDYIATRLRSTHYHVVASPAYLAAEGHPEKPADLQHHACLLFALPDYRANWHFRDNAGTEQTVQISGDITISNALALRHAALRGLGPALLADWLVGADIARGTLVDMFPAHAATATGFDAAAWLLYPSRAFLPRKVRVAIDFFRVHLGGSTPIEATRSV